VVHALSSFHANNFLKGTYMLIRLVPALLASCSLSFAPVLPLTAADSISAAIPAVDGKVAVAGDGQVAILPRFSTDGVNNSWPQKYQESYHKRVNELLPHFRGRASVNTTGEREKYDYPMTVGAFLAGDHDQAIAVLETEDIDGGDHAWTKGIDLYWGFTLKAQVLKFFYLEDKLTPAYRDRMLQAFKIFTSSDPRPTLEYALNASSTDQEVAAFATAQLEKMWRDKAAMLKMAESAAAEGHPNKKRFASYMQSIADQWPATKPASPEEWIAWWGLIVGGDWMVFEEYERRVNPNPHPKFGVGSGPVGATWQPAVRGMRADARNTDNLRGMRESAIYLFAERTGHELIRKLYKDRLQRTANSFFSVGNGEWDSPTYHPHMICAYLNLYAFAQDESVRKTAKAILDFSYAAGGLKYWRGAWIGPNKRDYGNYAPMQAAGAYFWLHFGDAAMPHHHHADLVWTLVSGYQPPAAAVALAHKDFETPVEMFNSHPSYSNWLPGGKEKPDCYETLYFGKAFNFGTLARGSRGDTNGFRVVTSDKKQGAQVMVAASGSTKRLHSGSGRDRVGQYQNLSIIVAPSQATHKKKGLVPNKLHWAHQKGVPYETHDGVSFVKSDEAWVALIPVAGHAPKAKDQKVGRGAKMLIRSRS
jgi:hypothetical protein